MGTVITRVPPGFQHPLDEEGDHIAGAHYEPLHMPANRNAPATSSMRT